MLRSGHLERAKRPPFPGGSAKASFLLAQHTRRPGIVAQPRRARYLALRVRYLATVGQASRWEAMSLFERGYDHEAVYCRSRLLGIADVRRLQRPAALFQDRQGRA